MSEYTADELISHVLDAAAEYIRYWAVVHALSDTALTVSDREGETDAERATVTAGDLRRWAADTGPKGPDGLAAVLGDPYQRTAVRDFAAALNGRMEPLDVDYDAETADCLVQWVALGDVIYS